MIADLRDALAARQRRTMSAQRRAAVLVPIIDDGGPRRLLLTRRAEHLPTHKGQVAFPGGGVDPGDRDVIDAALREAEEEVGLARVHVDVLGLLDDFPTVRGEQIVTPVVAHLSSVPPLRAEPGEVARIFSVPFAALRVAAGWRTEYFERGADRFPVYFFEHDGETLWGLSAYITLQLMSLTPRGAPFPLPSPWGDG